MTASSRHSRITRRSATMALSTCSHNLQVNPGSTGSQEKSDRRRASCGFAVERSLREVPIERRTRPSREPTSLGRRSVGDSNQIRQGLPEGTSDLSSSAIGTLSQSGSSSFSSSSFSFDSSRPQAHIPPFSDHSYSAAPDPKRLILHEGYHPHGIDLHRLHESSSSSRKGESSPRNDQADTFRSAQSEIWHEQVTQDEPAKSKPTLPKGAKMYDDALTQLVTKGRLPGSDQHGLLTTISDDVKHHQAATKDSSNRTGPRKIPWILTRSQEGGSTARRETKKMEDVDRTMSSQKRLESSSPRKQGGVLSQLEPARFSKGQTAFLISRKGDMSWARGHPQSTSGRVQPPNDLSNHDSTRAEQGSLASASTHRHPLKPKTSSPRSPSSRDIFYPSSQDRGGQKSIPRSPPPARVGSSSADPILRINVPRRWDHPRTRRMLVPGNTQRSRVLGKFSRSITEPRQQQQHTPDRTVRSHLFNPRPPSHRNARTPVQPVVPQVQPTVAPMVPFNVQFANEEAEAGWKYPQASSQWLSRTW